MTAIPVTAFQPSISASIRPIDLGRDMPQIIDLLEAVFHQQARPSASQSKINPSLGQIPFPFNLFQRNRPVPGFVWERDQRIIGNVSLLTTNIEGRFLIANVAVYPEMRRQGIARKLMQATMNWVIENHGREIFLQVEASNHHARHLYEKLQFQPLGTTTSWQLPYSRLSGLHFPVPSIAPDQFAQFYLRPLQSSDWQLAYQIDTQALHPDLNWPEPTEPDAYKRSLRHWWRRMINNCSQEVWLAIDNDSEQPIGLGAIESEWGRAHRLKLRVLPEWHGRVERPLFGKLLRRLKYLRRRPIKIEQNSEDHIVNDLLVEVGFHTKRTLTTMRYDVLGCKDQSNP